MTIAALVAGAGLLPSPASRLGARRSPISGTRNIEAWLTVSGTELARQIGVAGYYVRVAPPRDPRTSRGDPTPSCRSATGSTAPGCRATSRSAPNSCIWCASGCAGHDDPLILGSITLADALLQNRHACGPVWHRYNGDGYGEHDDGSAFDGTGIGRGWPLLTGERGHYELCAGRDPLPYLEAMAAMASPGGMLPEQVWDADPIPARRLFPAGRAARRCRWPGPMPNSSS